MNWSRSGIIPVTYVNGKWYFLLGLEHVAIGWGGSEKWTDFGGGVEPIDKSPKETAAREGYEETMGILGTYEEIMASLEMSPVHINKNSYTYFPYFKYSGDLVNITGYFKRFYKYIMRCAHKRKDGKYYLPSCPEGYFEKTDMDWFSEDDIKIENNILIQAVGIIKTFLDNRKVYELQLGVL
jgi:8-oxo-dGTP pyrophosphatase MutT (NUDIX family)